MKNYNEYIDHTLLKPEASQSQIDQLIQEAKDYLFASVCIMPTWVSYAHEKLKDSPVKVCTVIGFPLGAHTTKTKVFETKDAIENGADEIDMVINIGALKDHNDEAVYEDIKAVVEAAASKVVKVIIETCLLTDEEIVRACLLAKKANATFVKTSTGFSTGGATVEDVKLMKETVGDMEVKASGGIRDFNTMKEMIDHGATRIGTSSGIKIKEEYQK